MHRSGATLRVAMLLQSWWPVIGGAQRQVEQLAPLLAELGIQSRVITRSVPGTPLLEHPPGATVERVRVPASRIGASFAYTFGAARRARAWRPDVVHAFDLHSPALAALLAAAGRPRLPLVAKILSTGPGGDVDRLRHKMLGEQRLRLIARRFAAFQTLSEEVDAELLAAGVPRERLVRIPNGVDTDRFRPPATAAERSSARAALGLPADGPVTLYCGRFAPVKRLDLALDAFAQAPGHLLLLGDGPELAALRARAAQPALAGRVSFRAPLDDPADAYRGADAYLSASMTEGMSGSMLEAMATGVPVVASPASGVQALLGDGGGVIAPDDRLGPELAALLGDAERRRAAGERARGLVVERYALSRTAELLADLYRRLAA